MKYNKIAVVMGGPSSEAEVSRSTAKAVIAALESKGFEVIPVELHPETIIDDIKQSGCEAVFNAVHGKYGEDGILSAAMQLINMPCTGSGVLGSALTMNKGLTKRVFLSSGINTPKTLFFKAADKKNANIKAHVENTLGFPVVIKAIDQGSSIGVITVQNKNEFDEGLEEAFNYSREIIIEEFIKGRELTIAVYGNELKKALPIIEIIADNGVYDYHNKYTKGCSTHVIPAPLPQNLAEEIENIAIKACDITACSGIARVDIMLSEDNTPYVLEINTIPGMTETSLVPDTAKYAGIEFPELCEMILDMIE